MRGLQKEAGDSERLVLHTYLDFQCPYSSKLFFALKDVLVGFSGQVDHRVIVHVQPWHSQATQMALVVLACHMVDPHLTFSLMERLYTQQGAYSDQSCFDLSPRQLQDMLLHDAQHCGYDNTRVRHLLHPERRDGVVQHLKQHTKYARQNGVHVSPTVQVNGIVDTNVSSSWSQDQFKDWLKNQISAQQQQQQPITPQQQQQQQPNIVK